MNKLTYFIVFLIGTVNLSCADKTIVKHTPDEQQTSINDFIEGVITTEYASNGCDYLIKTNQKEKELIYNPINLDQSWKQNGKKIQFRYKLTRPAHNNCNIGSYIYILEMK